MEAAAGVLKGAQTMKPKNVLCISLILIMHMFKEVTTADFRAAIEKTAPSGEVKAILNEYLSPTR